MRNPSLTTLEENYLFEEIAARARSYPKEELLNLGIGDTTLPLQSSIVHAFEKAAHELGDPTAYSGYESSFGRTGLREAIAKTIYKGTVDPDDIFVSDGSKCDIARLQQLFSSDCSVAIQDPSYPAYIGASKISGKDKIHFMPCTPENNFSPAPVDADLIYLCSPNNPTGHVMSHEELARFVAFASQKQSILIFDSAYSAFIQDPTLPRSIYEIEGSKQVAIETGSFSKTFGFTGVRLGWLVIPKELTFADGHSVRKDWITIASTCFNGASNLAQAGGVAALLEATPAAVRHYMQQASLLKKSIPLPVYGGENAPYLWVDLQGRSSWAVFDELLQRDKIITTPGVGFGPSGEGFLRLSAFAKPEHIRKAMEMNALY